MSALMGEPVVGLDVETMLRTSALCLVQIAGSATTYLIDALELPDLDGLAPLLSSPATTKVIHNASFERQVLGRHGLTLEAVADTCELSRVAHGPKADSGHSLRAVCARELRIELDKQEQNGDWTRRPLTPRQVEYAALDAEVLLRVYARFRSPGAEPVSTL